MSGLSSKPQEHEKTASSIDVRAPKPYRVLLHNDHYTTMDFVVQVLQEVFHKPRRDAVKIMLHVHYQGIGVAGVYPMQIAEMKVTDVHNRARAAGFPLRCSMEPEE